MLKRKRVKKPSPPKKEEESIISPTEEIILPLKPKQDIHHRPEGKAPYKTKGWWCPYCGEWTSTNYNQWGYHVLKCCGISLKDFHVKRENKI